MQFRRLIPSLSNWLFLSASLVVCALALVTGATLNKWQLQQAVTDAHLQALEIAELIDDRLTGYFDTIAITSTSLSTIVSNNPEIEQAEFSQISARLVEALPDVINVAAAPGNIIRLVYPVDPNRSAIGLDYQEDPVVMSLIRRARQTRAPVLQGPVHLVQGGEGFIIRTAAYTVDDDSGTERYWGVVALVVDFDRMIRSLGVEHDFDQWDVSIAKVDAEGQLGQVIFGTGDIFPEDVEARTVTNLGAVWNINVRPANGWPVRAANSGPTWILVLGAAAFLLLMLHTFVRLFNEREVARKQLVQAIENLNDGFALYDGEDRLVLCNQPYRNVYGLSADLFVPGAKFEDIIREGVERGQYPEAIGNEARWIKERMAAHTAGDREIEQLVAGGRWLKIADRKTPEGGTVALRVDITELKTAIEQANAASRAKSDFMQVISHELRTPLTAVIGFLTFLSKPNVLPATQRAQALLRGESVSLEELQKAHSKHIEEIAQLARRALSSSEHLMRLIGDILNWSRLEQNSINLPLSVERLSSQDFMDSIIPQFEQLASDKGLRFSARVSDFEFDADPDRMRQVLINLVGNAIKFTQKGEVVLIADADDDKATFKVQDSGPGIAPEDQKKLFDQFYQVDSSATRSQGGIGLGLTISKSMVEMHNGSISIYSELGEGSEFVVTLPLRHRKAA